MSIPIPMVRMRRPGGVVSFCRLLLFLPLLPALFLTVLALPPTSGQRGTLERALPDTSALAGPRIREALRPELGATATDIGFPLDPVPVPADSQWWDGFSRPGANGPITVTAVFEDRLILGGDFVVSGEVRSYGVAGWDGSEWSTVPGDIANVEALAVYDGKLYAGKLGTCGAYLVRVWEGTSWGSPGDGIRAWDDTDYWHPQCGEFPDWVSALQVYDGKLYAGGYFWQWEGSSNPDRCLVQWDGEVWSSLGSAPDLTVEAMTIYDGRLIAGGTFRQVGDLPAFRIAAWDGEAWSALGTGINHEVEYGKCVYALTEYDGCLIAGGIFNMAGGIAVDRLASWDGSSWSSIGFEAGGYVGDYAPGVFALAVYEGKLIVGGRFEKSEGAVADNIAAWNGSTWEELGSGVSGEVYSLICYDDVLIACGEFTFAGGQVVYNAAMWDGEAWHPMGSGQGIDRQTRTFAVHDGKLVVGGDFTIAGETPLNHVAAWDGTGWSSMDEGWTRPKAEDLLSVDGELYGKHGTVIKRWNGFSWETWTTDFGEAMRTMEFYEGQLAAAGAKVALWNGLSWEPLGPASDGYVKTLLAVGGHLIAGGHFTEIGGIEARNVARWDGIEWSPMGEGLLLHSGYRYDDEGVSSLGFFEGGILAGGNFIWSGNTMVKSIAMWDGEAWKPLYKGISRDNDPEIYTFCVYNGTLIAGGDFRWAGDFPIWNIARWNGSAWSPMGSGIGIFYRTFWGPSRYIVDDLAVYDDCLYAAGFFNHTGGKPSCHIARWKDAFPGMVMHFEAAPSGDQVRLEWTNPAADVFRGTLVRYSTASHPTEPDDGEPVPNGNDGVFEGPPGSDTSFVFSGVNGVTYYLTAWAYDDDLDYSTPTFATTTAWDSVPPPEHPHFEAAAGTCIVRLAWTSPSVSDFQGTLIRFSNDGYPTGPEDGDPVPNASGGVFDDPAGAAASFIHDELECDTTYYYTAWAFDNGQNYSDPSYARARSSDPPDASPLPGFGASGTLEGILLEWTNPDDDDFRSTTLRFSTDGFPVHRMDGNPVPNGNDGVFEGVAGSGSSFVHSGVTAHEIYYYRAWADYEEGVLSLPVSLFMSAPDTVPPDPPISISASALTDGIRLRWRNALDLDVGGVLIRFALDTYPSIQTDGEPLPNGDDGFFEGVSGSYGSFAHTGLSGCEMYYYTAWSYDEFLRFSDPVHVSYISMIDTVNYFVANAGDRSVHLIWTAPLDERCEYHNAVVIRYSTEGPVYTVEDGQPVENGNEGRFVIHRKHDLYSFEHSELIPGATYYYSAFVVSDNPDRASIPVSRSAVPIKVVESVQGFEAEGEDRSVDLTWIAPVDTELEGLKIRYSRFAPPAELSEGTAVENGNDGIFEAEPGENGSYTHRGLINDTTYYYSIWAFDEAGYHSEPSHAQAVPLDNIPPDISVAVFQNPYLSEHIDIYVRASEELMSDSLCVSVGSDTVSMEIVPGGYSLYRGDHTLTAPAASITLAACACDLAGNRGCTTLDFAAGYLVAELGGTVSSPDGRMRLSIPPNTTTHDAFILVTPCFESGYVPYTEAASIWTAGTPDTDCGGMMSTTFSIGPVGLLRGNPAHLSIEYSDGEIEEGVHPDQLYIEQDDVGALPCYVDPGSRIVETDIHALGTFRLRAGERGASRILDPSYLRVGSPSPNPFEREITVRFELRAPQHVGVVVYDIAGREIARLSDGKMSPGMRHITWDGRGRMGEVPSGVYFLRIATDHKAATRKLLLLR